MDNLTRFLVPAGTGVFNQTAPDIIPHTTPYTPVPGTGGMGQSANRIPQAQPSMNFDMGNLMGRISGANSDVTTNTNVNTSQQQNRSPELEKMLTGYQNMLNTLGRNTQAAYQNKSNTYGDLIASLTNMYGAAGSNQAGAAQTSALSSGLTPLEAQQAGGNTLMQIMQQYYPALANTKAEQADVGIGLQNALAGLQQNLNLPVMQNIMSPYYQGVAGTKGTSQQTSVQTDPMRKLGLLAQLQQGQNANELGWAQLQQQGSQFGQTLQNQQQQFGQTLQSDLQKLMSQLGMEQYKTDVTAGTEQNRIQANAALQTLLQQMQGQQSQANIQGYGQNNLLNTLLSGNIQSQQSQQAWDRMQNLNRQGVDQVTRGVQGLMDKYFGVGGDMGGMTDTADQTNTDTSAPAFTYVKQDASGNWIPSVSQ